MQLRFTEFYSTNCRQTRINHTIHIYTALQPVDGESQMYSAVIIRINYSEIEQDAGHSTNIT